jgi:nitroimidazol reductase NimA-like FMN-containing flavoprotein (pyridoxamine 5'-phosphate oxidase superfamily)
MTLEEFEEQGMERMSDEEIEGPLSSQNMGVLALPTDGPPSMRLLSFWFDGESSLYFLYILGSSSRKDALSIQAGIARFLMCRAETMFNWRSVPLAGSINEVPAVDREAVKDKMDRSCEADCW